MKYLINYQVFEFNRKDKQEMQSSGMNQHFTIAFEFELECDDENLIIPEKIESLIDDVKKDAIDELEENQIDYDVDFIDKVLSTYDPELGFAPVSFSNDEVDNLIVDIIHKVMAERLKSWFDDENGPEIDYAKKMVEKHLPNFYNKWNNELKYEFDTSLLSGVEFSNKKWVTGLNNGIEMLEDFFNDFEKQSYWKMNQRTSIHINVGIDKEVKWNLVKGVVMLKDFKDDIPFVFKGIESRQESSFTRSLYEIVEETLKETDFEKFNKEEIEDYLNIKLKQSFEIQGSKSFALNLEQIMKNNYCEFRYVGGRVKKDVVIDKLVYFCYIVFLMTSDWKEKDYTKKLYKIYTQ